MINVFRHDLWPPSTSSWAVFFVLAMALTGLLAPWKRGRVLLGATVSAGVAALVLIVTRTDAAWAVLVLGWLILAAIGLGDLVLTGLRLKPDTDWLELEWVGLSGVLGFGCLSVCASVLGWCRSLNRGTAFATLALASLACLPRLKEARRTVCCRWANFKAQWYGADLRWVALGTTVLAACAFFPFLWATIPSVHWDAISAHLPVSQAYASPQGFAAVANYWFAYPPSQAHLLYALGLALVGQPLPGLLHFTFGLLTATLLFSLALRLAGRVAAWIATIAFASMPLVGWLAGSAYMDLFVTAFVFASVYAFFRWRESMRSRWLLVAGVFGGLGAACKANALMMVAPCLVYSLAATIRQRKFRATAPALLGAVAAILFLPAPWFLRNWIWTGNPFYPLYANWFHGNQPTIGFNWATFGTGHGVLAFFRLPWDLVVHGAAFDEHALFPFGLVPLAALVSLLLGHRKVPLRLRGLLLLLILADTLIWFKIVQVGRYLMPVIPLVLVLAVLPVPAVLDWLKRCHLSRILPAVALLGLMYVAYTRSVTTVWNYNLAEGYPYRYLLGMETRDQLMERALPVYSAYRYINSHRGKASRVFTPAAQVRTYLDVPLDDPIYNAHTIYLVRLPPGKDFIRKLIAREYDYLLIDRRLRATPYADQSFLKTFATLAYADKGIYVYKVGRVNGLPISRSPELLINGGFDDLDQDKNPLGWEKFGSPRVVVRPAASHSSPSFVEVTQESGWCQRVMAQPGRLYTVSLWVRALAPKQSAWLQVLWFDSAMKIVDTGIAEVAVDSQWQQHDATFTAPQSAAYAQVYARAAAGSTVWVDDVSLEKEER
jgi:4-amino-4-deoxy-L-arabinose transferase-like glycosyltransferase